MINKLVAIILATAAGLLVVSATLELEQRSFPCERLPVNVVPTRYELELDFKWVESAVYSGQVNISLKFSDTNDPNYQQLFKGLEGEVCKLDNFGPNTIVLHADPSIELDDIAVSSESCGSSCFGAGSGRLKKRTIRRLERDLAKQMIAIELSKDIHAGTVGQLSISFRGMARRDKRGIYASKFVFEKSSYYNLVSQFQPTDARLAFPLFDEPRFKAPFKVRLVHPKRTIALSNTEVEEKREMKMIGRPLMTATTFKQTLPMAGHMLALAVGFFDEPLEVAVKSSSSNNPYKVRVYTAPGMRESGRFALEVAQRSLRHFEEYIRFGFPLEKLDIVAIAELDRDNAESWGLALVRDSLVSIDDETKPDTRIATAVNVAHVCVHQWFANLISVAWWNDLWITEGVAAQFAFSLVRELYPHFQSEYFVRLATLSGAMQLDAPADQHALELLPDELHTSAQIYKIFDNIEFMKSASLAQMISKWMGTERADWYQRFLRRFVAQHANQIVTRQDYVLAMKNTVRAHVGVEEAHMVPYISKLIDSFAYLRGVPLVNARLEGSRLLFDVEHMHSARKDIAAPVEGQSPAIMVFDDVRVRDADADKTALLPRFPALSSEDDLWLADPDDLWTKRSSQPDINTYFRTRYSPSAYQMLCEPISARALSAMGRLQVLDDANALVQLGLIEGDTFQRLVDCYAHEDDGAVLLALMAALKTLASLGLSSPSSRAVLNIFEQHGFSATGQETFLEQRSRSVALKALVEQGNEQVIQAALRKFNEAPHSVALFLREPVYVAVVLHGSDKQVEQLQGKLKTTKSLEERQRLIKALLLSSSSKTLDDLREWLLHGGELTAEVARPFVNLIDSKSKPDARKH